jgi:hypothetical protein
MTLSVVRARQYLKEFELTKLFVEELGWDRHSGNLSVAVDGTTYTLPAIAEKRGVQIFLCEPEGDGRVPDYAARRKIEKQVTKSAFEHLIIFTDARRTTQIWQWVARQPGQPAAYREHHYHVGQHSGDALIQKLDSITFPLSAEEGLTLTGVAFGLRDAFDRDRVTKRFYDEFKRQHAAFLRFIKGVTEQGDREWYASLMLNRLMFVYFIQRKRFLDGDPDYLRNRLQAVQARKGKGKFLSFYRYFLLCLFHEGFSKQPGDRDLSTDLRDLLGQVPYLNGGLFELHELEQQYVGIDIPDEAFEQLFDFFDQWEWHLDTRPLRNDREINPDVLGYIFEKYINQKQMGAYYTKEDITEYISKNTVVPHLFDVAAKKCAVAFQPGSAAWRLLRDDPDRYLYDAVRKGVIGERGDVIALPEEVARGVDEVSKRGGWNKPAASDFALPTETWREHVARRQRCLEVREKLARGEVSQINDLVTYNLDIRQFAEDVIASSEGPELLRGFYQAISSVTVLDPTCGSGAFLFAALNILEPLYEACLDRMQAFVDDLERSGERHSPKKFEDFRRILADVDRHPNRRYFVLKSIVVNNLYGVDIMEEAVEICKLRLFLKLVAQIDRVADLEPLPDIDFNIRPGNTLVGFVTLEQIRKAATIDERTGQRLIVSPRTEKALRRIEEEAEIVERAFQKFHEMQTAHGMSAGQFASAKAELRERLQQLTDELDRYLAREYGVDPAKAAAYEKWRQSHQPFHWFAEFYGIMHRGGFDAIIGNPPYLERSKLGGRYSVKGFRTAACRDIYAWFVERAFGLRSRTGKLGLIVPVSIATSDSFDTLREVLSEQPQILWMAHFANRPGQLFTGAQNRLTILLSSPGAEKERVFSSRYHRWDARGGEREALLHQLAFVEVGSECRQFHGLYPKVGTRAAVAVLRKVKSPKPLRAFTSKSSSSSVYWVRVPGYFCQFFLDPPKARPERGGSARARGELNAICLPDADTMRLTHAVLNSSTYYHFFAAYMDGRHINPSDVADFPIDLSAVKTAAKRRLTKLSQRLEDLMKENTSVWRKSGLLIDTVDSRPTKYTLDEIDLTLGQHYGLSDEELDFIINYDIKYRMGQEEAEGAEE